MNGTQSWTCRSPALSSADLSGILVDQRWFPLILQRWPDDVSDDDLERFFVAADDATRRALREKTWCAMVVAARRGEIDSRQRRRVAKWVRSISPEIRERTIGSFLVVNSPMQRGAITALRYILPELKDVYPVESLEIAIASAIRALGQKGVSVPGSAAAINSYFE
jgi:hypothetical protein